MRKKILVVSITLILVVCFSINVFSSDIVSEVTNEQGTNTLTLNEQKDNVQNQINEANQQLEYVQGELSTTVIEIQKLNDQIAQYEKDVNSLTEQLDGLQKQLDNASSELSKIEEEYSKREQLLRKRIVAMYEAGDTSYLDVLLSSDSIISFISNYFMITQITEYDSNLLEEIENKKNSMTTIKETLEKQKDQVKLLKAKKAKMAIVLENSRTVQKSYVARLTEDEMAIQIKIDQYKLEQAQIEEQIRIATELSNGQYDIQYTGGVMIWPIAKSGTHITSPYGFREHPIQGVVKKHTGIDIGGAGYGAPAVAAADGVVSYASWMGGYGNCVMINHGNGIFTLYGHGQKILTSVGTVVKQGDLIMEVGSTGNSNGPHLHFEVRENNISVDPAKYLQGNTKNNP